MDFTSFEKKQSFIQQLQLHWPGSDYRYSNGNTIAVAIQKQGYYVAYTDLRHYTSPLQTIRSLKTIQRHQESFQISFFFIASILLYILIIFTYIIVYLTLEHPKFQNSPKWFINNYFLAILLLNTCMLLISIPSTQLGCLFTHILWYSSLLLIIPSCLLHLLEWYYRYENDKACQRPFNPQNMKIYLIVSIVSIFCFLLQILYISIYPPTTVISHNNLMCLLDPSQSIVANVVAGLLIIVSILSISIAIKTRNCLECKQLAVVLVGVVSCVILFEIPFVFPIINHIIKQMCCLCLILSILYLYLYKIYTSTKTIQQTIHPPVRYSSLERTTIKLSAVLPIRISNGFYKWEQSLIELVTPYKYMAISEGSKMKFYKFFRITNLHDKTTESFCFEVATNAKKYICQCDSKEELELWLKEYDKLLQ